MRNYEQLCKQLNTQDIMFIHITQHLHLCKYTLYDYCTVQSDPSYKLWEQFRSPSYYVDQFSLSVPEVQLGLVHQVKSLMVWPNVLQKYYFM